MRDDDFYKSFDTIYTAKIGTEFTYRVDSGDVRMCVLKQVTDDGDEGPYIQYKVTDDGGNIFRDFVMSKYGGATYIHNLHILNRNSVKHLLRQVRAK